MRLLKSLKKILSVIATSAVIFNSIAPFSVAIAQEITPSPTPTDIASPTPTDQPTIAPTESPTVTSDATPIDLTTPTPETSPTPTDLVTPTPSDAPVVTQAPESNPTTTAPPETPTVSASATPTATPVVPVEHGTLTETVINGIDLSGVTGLGGSIITDKADYSPTSLVLITGSGFVANKDYTINIVSSDPPPVNFTDQVKADSSGNISYAYQLDGTMRPNYSVYIKDGSVVVATTSFTDPIATDISQCQNGGIGDPLQPCSQTAPFAAASGYGYQGNANANGANSHWREGDFVPIRLVGTGYSAGAGNIQFSIDITKGGKHAYDYIGSFDTTETTGAPSGSHANHNNPVGDIISGDVPTTPDSTGVIPAAALSSFPVACGSNTFSGSQVPGSIKAWGTDGSLTVTYVSQNVGSSDCVTTIQVAWSGTKAGFGGTIVIAYAPHIASQADWGTGNSAISISGSPYHSSLVSRTTGGDTKGIGNQDAKLAASAVVIAAIPAVTTHVQNANNTDITSQTVSIGTVVHDNASVDTGSASVVIPTGSTFTFHRYSTINCTGSSTDQTGVSVPSGGQTGSANSNTFTPGAGVYSYLVQFLSGDTTKVTNATGVCEPFTVSQNSPTISTTLVPAGPVAIGASVHDSSTLTGATGSAGGTVTYHAYAGSNTCSGTDLLNSQVTVTNGVVPNSGSISFTNAGTYSFQAVYSGDSNNLGATSTCSTEQLVVSRNSPTIATVLTNTTINVGGSTNDTSTLSGATATAGGTVAYTVYSDSACTQSAQDAGTKTVTNGVVPNSNSITFNTAGDYYWQAIYSGDSNNVGAKSTCTDEHLVVNKLKPSIATTLSSTSIDVGTSAHDSSVLSGATTNAGGTATYTVYTDSACTQGAQTGGTKTVTNGVVPNSSDVTFTNAGTYYWQVVYSGDNNNAGATSTCTDEQLVVDPVTPALVTAPSATPSAVLGATLSDSATLTGGFNLTGTILFSLYGPSDPTCDGKAFGTSTVSVSGEGKYTSSGIPTFLAGLWNWIAEYSGDGNNNPVLGKCGDEPITLDKADTSVSTVVHNVDHQTVTSVSLGSIVHDNATVSGQIGNTLITGTVTYHFYTLGDCTGTSTDQTVSIGSESSDTSALGAGSYSYKAEYSGDSNYKSSVGICEPFTVNKAQLRITTDVHDSNHDTITTGKVALGSVVHDTASVSGAVQGFSISDPTFTLTSNYSDSCANGAAVGNDGTDPSNSAYKSANSAALGAGSYAYRATVAGNDNYIGEVGTCEQFSVNKSDPTITTTLHNSDHQTITSSTLDNTIHDLAEVLGIKGFVPTGNVNFHFYTGTACDSREYADAGTVTLNQNGIAHPSSSEGPLSPGVYSFEANYVGDSNYNTKLSDCEPFTVIEPPNVSITKSNNSGSGIAAGSTVTYTLTIKNTGGVDFDNVLVTDILPGGFTYVDGSTTGATFINVLGSKISWNLSALNAGDTAVITYQAQTDSNLTDGTYTNYATCQANYGDGEGSVPCDQVNSNVTIGHGLSYGGNLRGQVLGISTELPATGSPTALLIVSLGLLGTGLYLNRYNSKKVRKHAKN